MTTLEFQGFWDHYEYHEALTELWNLSLIRNLWIKNTKSYFSLHPLVQEWSKLRTSSQNRPQFVEESISALNKLVKTHHDRRLPLEINNEILSHLDVCIESSRAFLRKGKGL